MLLGSCAVGQGKLLYPKARFQYAYPMHAVELRRFTLSVGGPLKLPNIVGAARA